MTQSIQMNTRLDKTLKHAGDAILKRYGYSPSAAVQALWGYITKNNALPSFMPAKNTQQDSLTKHQEIQSHRGMAMNMLRKIDGLESTSFSNDLTDDELREWAWEERGAFDE